MGCHLWSYTESDTTEATQQQQQQKALQVFIELFNLSFFSFTCWGIDFDYFDTEWFALKMYRDHSFIFEIAPKCCISDSFVDYEGSSISSKGFMPTVIDIMVILVKFAHSGPFQFTDSCYLLFDHFQFTLIHGPNIPGSCAILFFTALDFTSTTSHIPSWALLSLWLCLFSFSGVISPLFSSSILGPTDLGRSSVSVLSFCLFILFMGLQGKNTEMVCHSHLQWTTFCQSSPP